MIFSKRKLRLFEIARAVALSGTGVGGRNGNNFRLGCIITSGHRVVASGTNSYKSSRLLHLFYNYPVLHAEANAILRTGFDACTGLDLYVARVQRNDTLALAKPCDECRALISAAGIRNVYYTTGLNGYERMEV